MSAPEPAKLFYIFDGWSSAYVAAKDARRAIEAFATARSGSLDGFDPSDITPIGDYETVTVYRHYDVGDEFTAEDLPNAARVAVGAHVFCPELAISAPAYAWAEWLGEGGLTPALVTPLDGVVVKAADHAHGVPS